MQSETDFARQLRTLKQDRVNGASALARQGLRVLAESSLRAGAGNPDELRTLLRHRAARLAAARPSMAPLHNLLASWVKWLNACGVDDMAGFRHAAAGAAAGLIQASERAVRETAAHACDLLVQDATVITHSLSSTMLEVFRLAVGGGLKAIVTESRPLNEGYALAAELSSRGLAVRLITEAQVGLFARDADVAMVGADSLLPDGSVLNKAGTYLLALASRDAGVPFYVCCERFKLRTPEMGEPELEEMDPAELDAPDLPNVEIRNIYFDITPPSLITGWITETGMTRVWDGRL